WSRSGSATGSPAMRQSLFSRSRLAHRQHPVHIGGAQLEYAAHSGERSDRLERDIHHLEQRTGFFRMIVLQLKIPFLKILRVATAQLGKRVLGDVAVRLVEELIRQRDMGFVDIPDLG